MDGSILHDFAKSLWPFNRSLTGEGVRQTLHKIKEIIPELEIKSAKSGKQIFDWVIPKEWKVNDAFIITPTGQKICDFRVNNLHLMGYSVPFRGKLTLKQLSSHLHSLPDMPTAIPYVTSYYSSNWSFCISQEERDKLVEGLYEVVVDTELFDGDMTYGEVIIRGETEQEILLSTYICHPSMANNELSGPVVTTYLAKWLSTINPRLSYRIVFVPETIGAINYIHENLQELRTKVIGGYTITCVGDDRSYSFLPTKYGNQDSDKIARYVLRYLDANYIQYEWRHRGSDERQYNAPGVDLPIASIMRTKYHEYPEYHTSLDDLENVVTPAGLLGGYKAIQTAIKIFELNKYYSAVHLCEPQMSKRNLYPSISSVKTPITKALMNFLSYSDGTNSVVDIAEKLNLTPSELEVVVKTLVEEKLIK